MIDGFLTGAHVALWILGALLGALAVGVLAAVLVLAMATATVRLRFRHQVRASTRRHRP
jgi:hypothetical protein